jgi:hypothetical protein
MRLRVECTLFVIYNAWRRYEDRRSISVKFGFNPCSGSFVTYFRKVHFKLYSKSLKHLCPHSLHTNASPVVRPSITLILVDILDVSQPILIKFSKYIVHFKLYSKSLKHL